MSWGSRTWISDKKKGMRSVSPEREDKEKELQWQFGQGTSENKMIGCKPTSSPLIQQHLQESPYYLLMDVFVRGDSFGGA